MKLELNDVPGRMHKISNNLLKCGSDDVPEFTIPVDGIMLTQEQLDAMLGQYTHRSWFNTRSDNIAEPCGWWSHGSGSFPIDDAYVADTCTVKVSGDQLIEFEGIEAEDDDEADVPACRISRIKLTPQVGGLTELAFHLSVRPEIGRKNLLLQEHQNREIRLTIGDAAVSQRKNTQQELPLGQPIGAAMGAPIHRPPDGESASDSPAVAAQGPAGDSADTESAGPTMGDAGWPPPENDGKPMTPEEQAEFERAAEKQVAAYNARQGEVIDGTTSRSRRRNQAEAH